MRASVRSAMHIPQKTMMKLSQVEGVARLMMMLEGISKRMYCSRPKKSAAAHPYSALSRARVVARHTGMKKVKRAML